MEAHQIERYAQAVFGFCLKRLNNIEDARDLSQDILCEALASMQNRTIEHFEPWLWKIARNRLSRRFRPQPPVISLDGSGLAEHLPADEKEDLELEKQAAFTALHTLATSHRDVLVDFYVHRLSCEQIASVRGLRPETVRSRLFYGREKLRKRWMEQMEENRIYQHQDWFMTGNGDVNTSLLKRQAVRSILTACYERFLTPEQISQATGIPCMYVEDELPALWEHELVEEKDKRWRTSMIIHSTHFTAQAESLLLQEASELTSSVCSVLESIRPNIQSIGFHGCDFPSARLWWSLTPMLLREACTQARSTVPELVRGPFPPRRDGSRGWLCAYQVPGGVHRYYAGCNAYYLEGSRFRYFWSHAHFSEELNQLLRRLETDSPNQNEELLAQCIRCDLITRTEDGFAWNIPAFTAEQAKTLQNVISEAARLLCPQLTLLAQRLHRLMKQGIPVHLHSQIRGVFGIEFNSVIDMVCREMERRGMLEGAGEVCLSAPVILLDNASAFRL